MVLCIFNKREWAQLQEPCCGELAPGTQQAAGCLEGHPQPTPEPREGLACSVARVLTKSSQQAVQGHRTRGRAPRDVDLGWGACGPASGPPAHPSGARGHLVGPQLLLALPLTPGLSPSSPCGQALGGGPLRRCTTLTNSLVQTQHPLHRVTPPRPGSELRSFSHLTLLSLHCTCAQDPAGQLSPCPRLPPQVLPREHQFAVGTKPRGPAVSLGPLLT